MRLIYSKKTQSFFLLILLLALTRIDFRFDEINPGSFVDDAEYYYHVQTIAIDKDLDYSNQMPNTPNRNLNVDSPDKVLPVHSIGVGIFAAPIVFIANLISEIINLDSYISFNYFIYSFVPVLYLLLSYKLLRDVLNRNNIKINNSLMLLLIAGSGVSYFAFERFSMSHVYEFFGTTLCIYIVDRLLSENSKNKKNILSFFLPIVFFLVLTIRWSNYFLFLIPLFAKIFLKKNSKLLYFDSFFILGFFSGLLLFLIHTKYLYGLYTLNPSDIFLVVEDRISSDYLRFFEPTLIFENIQFILKTFLIINISQEFGLAYFSPVLFFGNFLIFFYIYKKEFLKFLIVSGTLFFPFFSTLVLNNPGYSYGYRYFYSTIPIFIVIFFVEFKHNKHFNFYLKYFSIFAIVFQLFFESSEFVVLSSDYVTNTFGLYTKYVNPEILTGMFKSFLIFDSYLNIIFTSFLGVLIIKFISLFVPPLEFISRFRDPDEKIIELVEASLSFSWFMYVLVILFYLYIIKNVITRKKVLK